MSVTDGIGQTPCSLQHYLVVSTMQYIAWARIQNHSRRVCVRAHRIWVPNISKTISIGNGIWPIDWLRDRWRHVTPKAQDRHSDIYGCKYLGNGWR